MRILSIAAFSFLGMGLCSSIWAAEEIDIALSEVPVEVLKVARGARQDVELTEAEKIIEQGRVSYELEGRSNGEEIEILISADGTLIGIELDD